jgi:hypothetical protein
MQLNVSLDLMNKILAYLGTQPYSSVYALFNEINAECMPQLPAQPVADDQATTAAETVVQ